ncbi:hypothetical protein J2S78_000901 [Salibacterium salarium]|uniref:hypothetical protein n=1 Tax=Salibacterium salarium TaxID=284579 RepID=UPI002786B616|nr:hypothetical protein [Salibacterium salarium]MDQ0298493.1 hypothetical protein [Salibacterium salarium]
MKRLLPIGVFTLFLSACSQADDGNMIQSKELTDEEQYYLGFGLDQAGILDVESFDDEFDTFSFVVNFYEKGEKIEEKSGPNGLQEGDFAETDDIVYGLRSDDEDQIDFFTGTTSEPEQADTINSQTMTVPIELPFSFDQKASTQVQQIKPKSNEMSPLILMHSGNSLSSHWFEKEELSKIIEQENRVVVIGLRFD